MISYAIMEPSTSVVVANDSFKSTRLLSSRFSMIEFILPSSSSSLPLFIALSSRRVKCVKRDGKIPLEKSSAATGSPACIMTCAMPTLRRNVDFPPWLAPVIMTSCLFKMLQVLPTALTRCSIHITNSFSSIKDRFLLSQTVGKQYSIPLLFM